MVHRLDPARPAVAGNRIIDPDRAGRRPKFVGDGRGLTIAVTATIALLLVLAASSALWLAKAGWRWWRAPDPTRIVFDPATEPRAASAAAAIGSQAAWFSADSYPVAARRAGEQGRVSVRLLIEADGSPSACEVISSSGSSTLDATTCRLAVRNGRFAPARAADGAPIRGVFTMRNVVWRLES